MRTVRLIGIAFFLCALFIGCTTETRENLLIDTIKRMDLARSQVDNITAEVNTAVKAAEKDPNGAIDLTKAGKLTEDLKLTGTKIVEIKQRIDMVRSTITEEEKKTIAEAQRDSLNTNFKKLLDSKEQLRTALAAAEKYDKIKTEELRKKIVEAEGPFEAQSR